MKRSERKTVLVSNALILLTAAAMYLLLLSPAAVFAVARGGVGAAYRGSDNHAIALRIPVIWEPSSMETILDALEKGGAKATFAFTPETVEACPTLISRISRAGHGVELTLENSEASGKNAKHALKNAMDAVERITGERPAFFYVGAGGEANSKSAVSLGMKPVSTTYDLSCAGSTSAIIEKRLKSHVEPGAIYTALPTASFAEALPFLIDLIKNMGLDIVPIHKMLYN